MNTEPERREKRPADTLEHIDQQGNLRACPGCGAALPPYVVGDSRKVCRMCGVNGARHETSIRQPVREPRPAAKKRRITPMSMQSTQGIVPRTAEIGPEDLSFPPVGAELFKRPPRSTESAVTNVPASDGMGLDGAIDMIPSTTAESKDSSGAAHLPAKQQQPFASSSATLSDNEGTSSERHTLPNTISLQNAHISNEDVLAALQMCLSCPGILRSHHATDNRAILREARFAWATSEQAIHILTRLKDMIQLGYQLPPTLTELCTLQVCESHAQAPSGKLAASEEPRDASSVAPSMQISENGDASLVDKHGGGTTCNSLAAGADDSVRSTPSPLPQGSTWNVPGSNVISQAACRLDTIQDRNAILEQENANLRYQVATLRKELDAMGRARVDALRHGCETIDQLCGVVKQHKCKEEHHERIVKLTEDVACMKKRLKRDRVFFDLALTESRQKLEQVNSRAAETASRIPKAREFSDAGVDTERAQYVSTGVMHELSPSPDVHISTSRGPQGCDYKEHEATPTTPPPRATTETRTGTFRLKLAEAESIDLRAKLAHHEQFGIDLPAISSLSFTTIPFDPSSVLAQRCIVPGFTDHIVQLEQEADRYIRRQRKRASKDPATCHRHP